jgi:hypothetical protein
MPPQTPITSAMAHHHGKVRGADLGPRSPLFEGRFGRMFRSLPPAEFSPADLRALAKEMIKPEPHPTPADDLDAEENSGITAGYTYLGQFIDHDLTFDPASSLQQQDDPDALVDFRTPRFDLDSVYGRGPADQPYLYRDDGVHMLLGVPLSSANDAGAHGLPRNAPEGGGPARALIGDKRNDENVIVSQLHAVFLRFHNKVADLLTQGSALPDFEEAQRFVRWHYQWVVLNDFLPTIIRPDVLAGVAPHIGKKTNVLVDPPDLRFYKPKKDAFIPVEFSVAAYRFGHSMVRPTYRLSPTTDELPIFSTSGPSLVGFQPFPTELGIDWGKFFRMDSRPAIGPTRRLPAYKIDTSLVDPLGNLPSSVADDPPPSLAERNLLRGLRMGLPSGQVVAMAMGVPLIPDTELKVGKATEEDSGSNRALTAISPAFTKSAPLWYYILAEAQQQFQNDSTAIRLGPVGGRIVAEVFIGLMLEDKHSFLRQNALWQPFAEFRASDGTFGMADLIRAAQS